LKDCAWGQRSITMDTGEYNELPFKPSTSGQGDASGCNYAFYMKILHNM
jgi:hypothetical protein